jgi:predicted GNAT superfamily acetyltransferase
MSLDLHIHPLMTMDALTACEGLQLQVWGYGDREVVPAAQMRASLHAGALVAGAFVGRELVGFLYAFPALAHEEGLAPVGLHSHMMAVLPEARGLGLGRRLKWYQRRWCLERGLSWVAWTFDPLQAGNARLNLEHLGVVVHEYQVDFYGVLGGLLSGDQPTDRFLALWPLTSERVAARAAADPFAAAYRLPGDAPRPPAPLRPQEGAWALTAAGEAVGELRTGLSEPAVWVAAPREIARLRREEPRLAAAWNDAFRAASVDLVERGYEVRAFVAGAYCWRPRHELDE